MCRPFCKILTLAPVGVGSRLETAATEFLESLKCGPRQRNIALQERAVLLRAQINEAGEGANDVGLHFRDGINESPVGLARLATRIKNVNTCHSDRPQTSVPARRVEIRRVAQ